MSNYSSSDVSSDDGGHIRRKLPTSSTHGSSDGDDELVQELLLAKRARLTKIGSRGVDGDSESPVELESDNDESHFAGPRRFIRGSGIVDKDNREIQYEVVQVAADIEPTLTPEGVTKGIKLFGEVIDRRDRQSYSSAPSFSLPETRSLIPDLGDRFERDCDRYNELPGLFEEHHKEVTNFVLDLFRKAEPHDPRFDEKHHANEETEEPGPSFIQIQRMAIENILRDFLGQGPWRVHMTPQFIINHRCDVYRDAIFTDEDVYRIRDRFKEYLWFVDARSSMELYCKTINGGKVSKWPEMVSTIGCTHSPNSKKSFNDIDRYREYFPLDSQKSSAHALFLKNRTIFEELTNRFLISPDDLALHYSTKDHQDKVLNPPEPTHPPESVFEMFLNDYPDYRNLLISSTVSEQTLLEKQVIRWAAEDLAINPFLLYMLRQRVTPHLVINTSPTPRGETSDHMLPYGKYGSVKRLRNKPMAAFEASDLWLIIDEARSTGLLNVEMEIDVYGGVSAVFDDLKGHYVDAFLSSNWNAIRIRIIKRAFYKHIWPQFIAEAESELFTKAAAYVKSAIEDFVFAKLTAPPYTKRISRTAPLSSVSILSFAMEAANPQRVIGVALVNPQGAVEYHEVIPILFLGRCPPFKDSTEGMTLSAAEQKTIAAKQKLFERFRNSYPDLIVIAANCLRARRLYEVVNEIFRLISTDLPIIFAPSDAAHIYAHSPIADPELHQISRDPVDRLVLTAASTARRVQNPLVELTRLCIPIHNYLCDLALHPFQGRLIRDGSHVHDAVERACLRSVGITGVDFTLLNSPHHRGPLQFIPGLGPKWSEQILRAISTKSPVTDWNRRNVEFDIFTPSNRIVCQNAISFLRFPSQPDDSGEKLFDGTMLYIDPDYPKRSDLWISRGLMNHALGRPISSDPDTNRFFEHRLHISDEDWEVMISNYCEVANLQRTPQIDFIARELSISPRESLRFKPIFRSPESIVTPDPRFALSFYREHRARITMSEDNFFVPLSDAQLFDLLVGSYDELRVGAVAQFRIKLGTSNFIAAVHDSGVDARQDHPEHYDFEVDSYQPAVVRDFDYLTLRVLVSFDEREVAEAREFRAEYVDEHFDLAGEIRARELAREEARDQTVGFSRRMIDEDGFRNVSFDECCAELANQSIGSFMFRPSSKGCEHLSLTIRFPGGAFGQYDIVERGKRSENDLTLGQELSIENMTFDNLDEVRWNFVAPLVHKLQTVMRHRNWVENKDVAAQFVLTEYRNEPKQLHYRLTIDPKVQNCIILTWLGMGKLWEEPIRLRPDDVMWRHNSYPTIESVISEWKKNGYRKMPTTDPRPIEGKRTEREEKAEQENNRLGGWGNPHFHRK
jgi:transcription elongation factor SPT6